ncbi:hypothetical protein ACOMHN_059769 [Nucella lapillus]
MPESACQTTMLPEYNTNRIKRAHKLAHSAARRLRDIEFDKAEDKENSLSPVLKQVALEKDRQYKMIYTAKRTKRMITNSTIPRRLVFSVYEQYERELEKLDHFHMCKVPRTSVMDVDVSKAQEFILDICQSFCFDDVQLGGGPPSFHFSDGTSFSASPQPIADDEHQQSSW